MASLLVIAAAPVVATPNTDKVSLCHATRSTSNPYVLITIDPAAIFRQGHDNHHHADGTTPVTFFDLDPTPGPGDKASWDDIIPSFDYTTGGTVHTYPGKNWPADAPKWGEDGAIALLLEICTGGREVPPAGQFLEGGKYYDTNRNGLWDSGEPGIQGWPIVIEDGYTVTVSTGASGLFSEAVPDNDTYTVQEVQSNSPWVQTGPAGLTQVVNGPNNVTTLSGFVYTVSADGGDTSGLFFGNVCEVRNQNGLTLGYWSNKNGAARLLAGYPAVRTLLNGLNLVGFTQFPDPATTAQQKTAIAGFQSWLLASNATNMSRMLSAQLAATALNVLLNGLDGNALVQDPANPGSWITINKAIQDAKTFLAGNQNTTAAGPLRTLAEAYKNLFDALNNNLATVTPSGPLGCPTPVFP